MCWRPPSPLLSGGPVSDVGGPSPSPTLRSLSSSPPLLPAWIRVNQSRRGVWRCVTLYTRAVSCRHEDTYEMLGTSALGGRSAPCRVGRGGTMFGGLGLESRPRPSAFVSQRPPPQQQQQQQPPPPPPPPPPPQQQQPQQQPTWQPPSSMPSQPPSSGDGDPPPPPSPKARKPPTSTARKAKSKARTTAAGAGAGSGGGAPTADDLRAAFRAIVPPSTAVAIARGAIHEDDASFNFGDLRSVANAHGFEDWSDDNLRSMMGTVVESNSKPANPGAPLAETTGVRVRLADLAPLAQHVGAKKSVM